MNNNVKSFLWIQSPTAEGQDIIRLTTINHVNVSSDSVYRYVLGMSESNEVYKCDVALLKKLNLVKSKGFRICADKFGGAIYGTTNETDEFGRHIPYMFYFNSHNFPTIKQQLIESLKEFNYTVRDDEIDKVISWFKNKKKIEYVLIIIVILTIIFLWRI